MINSFRYYNVPCEKCYHFDWQQDIFAIKSKMSKLLDNKISKLYHGFCSDEHFKENVEDLKIYLDVIEDELRVVGLGGSPCIDDNKLQILKEKIRDLTRGCTISTSLGVDVDKTGVNDWLKVNPYCSSRQEWEKCSYDIFDSLSLDIDTSLIPVGAFSKDQAYSLSFDIVSTRVNVDVIVAIAISKINTDLRLQVDTSIIDYNISFDLLSKYDNFNLTLESMISAITDHNLSLEVIDTIYKNNLQLITEDDSSLLLKSDGGVYPISGFNFKEIPSAQTFIDLGFDAEDCAYLEDTESFTNNISGDYC